MLNNVKTSTLPQHELWTIEYAETLRRKAFQDGIPRVLDEEALLDLIKHAWQWDKNAMIQYAKILESEKNITPDYNESLSYFIKKYSHEFFDKNGKPLQTPAIFQLSYHELIKALADKKYPTPSSYMAVKMMGRNGDTDGIYNELSEIDYSDLIKYTKYSIAGGYRYHDLLANTILFRTGLGYRDINRMEVNALTDRVNNIREEDLSEAFEAYTYFAKHGSQYCMIKLAEFYFNGIVVNKNALAAHVWSKLAKKSFQCYHDKTVNNDNTFLDQGQTTLNEYNKRFITEIESKLTPDQLSQSIILEQEINQLILTWDFTEWESRKEDITLML